MPQSKIEADDAADNEQRPAKRVKTEDAVQQEAPSASEAATAYLLTLSSTWTPAVRREIFKSMWKQDAGADITIKIGEWVMKCHKLVLCSQPSYFKEAAGPGGGSEAQSAIELDAKFECAVVEAALRFLYTSDYEDKDARGKPIVQRGWRFNFNVALAAKEFDIPDLASQAFETFRMLARNIRKTDAALELLRVTPANLRRFDRPGLPEDHTLAAITFKVMQRNLKRMLGSQEFRDLVDGNAGLRWSVIDMLAEEYPTARKF